MTAAAASSASSASSTNVAGAHVATHAPAPTKAHAPHSASTIDAKQHGGVDVDEVHEAKPKLDHYDRMKVGAPSPDCSGLLDDDADADGDVPTIPAIPSRVLNNRVRA